MELATLQQKLGPLCLEFGIERLGVFGSVARGDDNASSDIDLIVKFKDPVGMLDLIDVEERMEKLLAARSILVPWEVFIH